MTTQSEMHEKMAKFYNSHIDAKDVLDSYNEVDPFHCYYGEDCNPDEYLSYAVRYMKNKEAQNTLWRVYSSFHQSQFDEGFLTEDHCEKIAQLIEEKTKPPEDIRKNMKRVTKTSIPAGDNPFHHDSISVGLNLGNMLPTSDKRVSRLNDVYIMASGMNDLHDFYIVDTKTGERVGIKLP